MDDDKESGKAVKKEGMVLAGGKRGRKPDDEPFPPRLRCWQWPVLVLAWVLGFVAFMYVACQLCGVGELGSRVCWTYVAFGFVLAAVVVDRWMRHKLIVHKARREDISEVEALFVEAETVQQPRSGRMARDAKYFEDKKKELQAEVRRLKEKMGNKGWTEYQVLSLNQMVVEFLEEDELKARARVTLAELEEFATDSSYRYDWEQYIGWRDTIDEVIDAIDSQKNKATNTGGEDSESKVDKAVDTLQAELITLLEHVVDYKANWAEGSTIIRNIMTCGVVAVPIVLGMGLLPILHPGGEGILHLHNWGLLGIAGAITAVLLSLRRSDFVEVGNTEGKKELWRAILSIALGLVAGILFYSMISGGILSGSAFPSEAVFPKIGLEPSVEKAVPTVLDIGRSIFWGIASGYSFELVFERLRGAVK